MSNRHVDTVGEEEGGTNWERSIAEYPLSHVKQLACGAQRYSPGSSAWCSLMTYKGAMRGGREVQERGDIWKHTADSLHCTAENNTALESNYIPIKKGKKETVILKTFYKNTGSLSDDLYVKIALFWEQI